MKDNRRAVKAFANPYYEALNKGLIPRSEIKREFYDKGKQLFKENTLDAVWTAFMEGTYNPGTNSLGATKFKIKEKEQIMETTNKRGPKPRKIQFMDSKFEDVLKTFDSVSEVASHFDMKESTVRSVLKLKDDDKIGKDYKKRLRYEPKISTPNIKEEKKIKVTISQEVKVSDIPESITQPVVEETMKEFNELYEKPEDQVKEELTFEPQEEIETPANIPYKQQLLNKLDDARNAYIEALKNYAISAIAQYGIDLEEKDIHLVAYLDEEFK